MKIITAILIIGMALLCGCTKHQEPYVPMPSLPQPPNFSPTAPAPIVEPPTPIPESQVHISDAKVSLISDINATIEFSTNIPATSSIKLLRGETEVDKQIIAGNTQYHYYRFDNLKQSTLYNVVIEANSTTYATYDKTVINFTTLASIPYEPPFRYPSYFMPYYPPAPITPVTPTPMPSTVFWQGSVTVTITNP